MLYNWEPTGIQCPRKIFEECDGHTKPELVMTLYNGVYCRLVRMMIILMMMMMTLFYLALLYTIPKNRQKKLNFCFIGVCVI